MPPLSTRVSPGSRRQYLLSDKQTAYSCFPMRQDSTCMFAQANGCRLQPRAVLQPPDLSALQHGRPSAALPSDHILLMAEFNLQPAA
jgi:hypothetical protein